MIVQSGLGAIRTRDLLLRRQALYPTELRARKRACKVARQTSFRNCVQSNG